MQPSRPQSSLVLSLEKQDLPARIYCWHQSHSEQTLPQIAIPDCSSHLWLGTQEESKHGANGYSEDRQIQTKNSLLALPRSVAGTRFRKTGTRQHGRRRRAPLRLPPSSRGPWPRWRPVSRSSACLSTLARNPCSSGGPGFPQVPLTASSTFRQPVVPQ